MKILIVNGPNLNMLGLRETHLYGEKTYADLCQYLNEYAASNDLDIEIYQSNHEGDIVEIIQKAKSVFDAIIINAAAYTHTSVAILDALKAVDLLTVEVHMSNIKEREKFRQFSYVSLAAEKVYMGEGFISYKKALDYIKKIKG